MIVVATGGKPCVDDFRVSTRHGQAKDPSAAVEQQRFSIGRPIWRFDAAGCDVDHPAVPSGRCD